MEFNEFKSLLPNRLESEIVLRSMFAMTKFNFPSILEDMSKRISYGGDSFGFMFPEACEPDDDDCFEEGVQLFFGESTTLISDKEFNDYLSEICKYYGKRNPDVKLWVESLLKKITS